MVAATEPVPVPAPSPPAKEDIPSTSAPAAPEKAPVKPEPVASTLTPAAPDDHEDGEISDSDEPDDEGGDSDFEIETEQHSTPPADDESVQFNQGCGIPCRFWNHDRCMRGADCGYLHGPDDKSIRDTHSKNVCLYFLLGTCKFGPTKCAYSHRRDWLPAGWWDTEEGVAGEIKRMDDARRDAKEARRAAAAADKEARAQRKREQAHLNSLLSNLTNGAQTQPQAVTTSTSTIVGNGHPQQNGVSFGVSAGAVPTARRRNPPTPNPNPQPRKPRPVQQQQQHQPAPPPQPGLFPAQFHAPMQPSMSLQELAERMQQLHLLQREQQAQAQRHGFTERQVLDLAAYGIKPWDEGALTTLNMLYHY